MVESALKNYLENTGSPYAQVVYDAMSYSIFGTGKRTRPTLTLMFSRLLGGKDEQAVPFACAVEMIHTYSLIHDDLPCMDNDDMRRGRASNHIKFGEDIALLAGDGLLTKAFEICTEEKTVSLVGSDKAIKAAHTLAKLAGVFGMVGGQAIDLKSEGRDVALPELAAMVMGKTVALIKAACMMGAIVAGGTEAQIKAAEEYAIGIGMSFQIRDDILDVIGDPAKMGKNIGVDKDNDRRNFVTMYGLDKAQELVDQYTDSAIAALESFEGDTWELKKLAIDLAGREN